MGRYVESSIAYATMLVASSNVAQARRIYKRGHSRKFEENGRVFLCEAWLRLEREHGTAESLAEVSCQYMHSFQDLSSLGPDVQQGCGP